MKYEQPLSEQLEQEGILTQEEVKNIAEKINTGKFSLHWELRTLLYIGISMFTGGLGIFIYQNIGSIGHIILILLLFLGCIGSYYYAFLKALPYSNESVTHFNPFYDYTVLLAALLFVAAQGYLQFQFQIYGDRMSFPTLISSLVLFATAFRFDHKGVLTLAISLHAAFWGLVVTPLEWMQSDFTGTNLPEYIHSGIVLGALLYTYAWICRKAFVKVHFVNTFMQFAVNILLVALLAGTFGRQLAGLYYLGLLGAGYLFFREAKTLQSFAIFLSMILAEYIGLSYWVFKALLEVGDVGAIYATFIYIIVSCLGVIHILRNHKHYLQHDTIQ